MYPIKRCPIFFAQRRNPVFLPELVKANRVNLERIYQHPFNRELFNGSLPPQTFRKYLRDDYYYLKRYSSVLLQLARSTVDVNAGLSHHLKFLAEDIINSELTMQQQYQEHLADLTQYKPGKSIVAYTEFLEETVHKSHLSVALSSILPCFWIYRELGMNESKPIKLVHNPYRSWIETYSGDAFITATQLLAHTINQLADNEMPTRQKEMEVAFATAVQHELNFFDEVYPHEFSQFESAENICSV